MRLAVDGRDVLGPADLYLPEAYRAAAARASCRPESGGVAVHRQFGPASLDLRYEPAPAGLRVRSRWSGTALPRQAALYVPVVAAARWWAHPAEGRLEDRYEVRHLTTTGILTNFGWRPQGTNVVWDSLLQPLEAGCGPGPGGVGGRPDRAWPSPAGQRRPGCGGWIVSATGTSWPR